MSQPVYVAAIWSVAHGAWAEFVVSPDAAKVRAICAPLAAYTATHVRIVTVERDDWDLIRPALSRLGAPPKSYTPREFEMFCEERRVMAADFLGAAEAAAGDLVQPVSFERRRRLAS